MIKLELELGEVNGILSALERMPFAQVADLVAKIQGQASPQVQTNGAADLDDVAPEPLDS